MTKTVLLTGASTGIGRATALLFHQKGWNVAATMRSPDKATDLAGIPNLICLPLDVTDQATIQPAINAALKQFGAIDVLINNAGYALAGPFEACTEVEIRRQFETNVFGVMALTRAMLPHFRYRRAGTIVNVASIGGQMAFPLYSPYHATKWAVEGFSDSLHYELKPLNIKVKVIEPGPIKTDFYTRSISIAKQEGLTDYDAYIDRVLPSLAKIGESGSPPEFVANIIYQAVTDGSWRLRYPAGGNAGMLIGLRKLLPDWLFEQIVKQSTKG
jgi:NAD(P)-dependent dehydrogenase (short-subunit alcohol dehydrogenase family)